ncbi:hypothetical protein RUM44_001224 [Polyplax serrata]|uniref:Uncharacterized protein n=1 Tax=Polyplax serrata TaxID=468196 RepID=A0ABR1AJF3_POLSC
MLVASLRVVHVTFVVSQATGGHSCGVPSAYVGKGITTTIPMNPVLTGLIATATTLVIVVCLVLLALYRRSRFRRPISKQAVVLVSEVLEDTRPCSPTLPLNPANSSSGDHRITDDTDPDVIPNKYGGFFRQQNSQQFPVSCRSFPRDDVKLVVIDV